MTLCDLIIEYRTQHDLSQRQFAAACGLSNGYISMLEKNLNPNTGLPLTPSLPVLNKIATGMGIPLHELMLRADDMPIDVRASGMEPADTPDQPACDPTVTAQTNTRAAEFVALFSQLTPEQQALVIAQIRGILSDQ